MRHRAVSRRDGHCSTGNADATIRTSTVVLPIMDFGDENRRKRGSDMEAKHKESRVRNEVMRTCARVRSNGAAVQTGDERLLRKRATPTRPEVSGITESGGLADSTRLVGRALPLGRLHTVVLVQEESSWDRSVDKGARSAGI